MIKTLFYLEFLFCRSQFIIQVSMHWMLLIWNASEQKQFGFQIFKKYFDIFTHISICKCLDTSWDISGTDPGSDRKIHLGFRDVYAHRLQIILYSIFFFFFYCPCVLSWTHQAMTGVQLSAPDGEAWEWGVLALSLSDEERSTDS